MKEILRTNNLVLIPRIQSILNDFGIQYLLLDAYTSDAEGSISAIEKRIVVSLTDFKQSKKLINEFTNNNENE